MGVVPLGHSMQTRVESRDGEETRGVKWAGFPALEQWGTPAFGGHAERTPPKETRTAHHREDEEAGRHRSCVGAEVTEWGPWSHAICYESWGHLKARKWPFCAATHTP